MIKRKIVPALFAAAFLAVMGLLLTKVNDILEPKFTYSNSKWAATVSYSQFYEMERDSVDVLFLGPSSVMNAFCPQVIYSATGIRSFNLGSEKQTPLISSYWLEEALQFQSPKAVIFDTRFAVPVGDAVNPIYMTESLIRKSMDPMKWSPVKWQAVNEICSLDKSQSLFNYIFPNIRFHDRWKELDAGDFESPATQADLKGFSFISDTGVPVGYEDWAPNTGASGGSQQSTDPVAREGMERIAAFCREKDIELILVSLPGDGSASQQDILDFASENNLRCLNFSEEALYQTVTEDLQFPRDNVLNHANIWGSIALSRYIAFYLQDELGITGTQDSQYDRSEPVFQHVLRSCTLVNTDSLNDYLSILLEDPEFTICLSVKYDAAEHLTEKQAAAFRALGLDVDLQTFGLGTAAVLSEGTCHSEASAFVSSISGSFFNKNVFYTVKGTGSQATTSSSIEVNGQEYGSNERGITLVIYDNILKRVIDSVNFNTHDSSNPIGKHSEVF